MSTKDSKRDVLHRSSEFDTKPKKTPTKNGRAKKGSKALEDDRVTKGTALEGGGSERETSKRSGEDAFKDLPYDLVEKIFASMAYPQIFKIRLLSKSWLTRFSSVDSLDDEEEKILATSFHEKMSQLSNNWPEGSFIPGDYWYQFFKILNAKPRVVSGPHYQRR